MNCPSCSTPMKLYEKRGIDIDLCPACRGVWLDRGELDKLLEVEAKVAPPFRGERDRQEHGHGEYSHREHRENGEHYESRGHEHDGHDKHDKRYGHQGRRKSLLGEIFGGFGGDD